MKFIPLSVPNLKGREKEYVLDAVEREWVSTGGAYIERLEKEIADYLKVDQAVACQSGTAGLHLALLHSGVEKGDEVIVPTLTFIAAVNPVSYVGAFPVFMDCDSTFTMDAVKLRHFIENACEYSDKRLVNKVSGRTIKAIVVVHVFGNAANMTAIMEIAKQYNLRVIEDATEALGSYYVDGAYKDKYLGTIADFGVYSFNGNKIITTGGGGMLVAKDSEQLKHARYLSTQAKDDLLFYQHNEVGYNYRMTNLQAALGVAQLEQLEDFITTKKRNYELYNQLFKECKAVELMGFVPEIRPNYWFYSLCIKNEEIQLRDFIKQLEESGIQTRPIWGLIHQQRPYRSALSYKINQATYYQEHIINLPCSSNLTEDEVRYVAKTISNIIYK